MDVLVKILEVIYGFSKMVPKKAEKVQKNIFFRNLNFIGNVYS
jgi:hypothetical protein